MPCFSFILKLLVFTWLTGSYCLYCRNTTISVMYSIHKRRSSDSDSHHYMRMSTQLVACVCVLVITCQINIRMCIIHSCTRWRGRQYGSERDVMTLIWVCCCYYMRAYIFILHLQQRGRHAYTVVAVHVYCC